MSPQITFGLFFSFGFISMCKINIKLVLYFGFDWCFTSVANGQACKSLTWYATEACSSLWACNTLSHFCSSSYWCQSSGRAQVSDVAIIYEHFAVQCERLSHGLLSHTWKLSQAWMLQSVLYPATEDPEESSSNYKVSLLSWVVNLKICYCINRVRMLRPVHIGFWEAKNTFLCSVRASLFVCVIFLEDLVN